MFVISEEDWDARLRRDSIDSSNDLGGVVDVDKDDDVVRGGLMDDETKGLLFSSSED